VEAKEAKKLEWFQIYILHIFEGYVRADWYSGISTVPCT
jgi:hypothetical protein